MSLSLLQEIQQVTPTQEVQAWAQDYADSYAMAICLALLEGYGEDDFRRWFPGGLQECVQKAREFAKQNFKKWEIKWGPMLAYRIKMFSAS